jgi:signal transduction histidine kinase
VVFDIGVAAVVAVFAALMVPDGHPPVVRLVGFAMAVALLGRRRWPLPVLLAVSGLALLQVLVDLDGWAVPHDIAVLVAMYSTVKYADRVRDGLLAIIPVAAGLAIEVYRAPVPDNRWSAALWYVSIGVATWAAAYTVRTRRLYVASLEERAATAEREREHLARIAIAQERAAIARELHDVVAHSLAVMVVQADGAAYALDQDTDAARGALRQVAATGREALDEMGRLVHVLRDGMEQTGGDDRIEAVVDRARSAGLTVTLTRADPPGEVPATVQRAAYRIVQEALTNVLRHAGQDATVTVRMGYEEPGALTVEVTDDGAGRLATGRSDSGGHGLVGMRERVAVYGGQFEAAPRMGAGWRVRATLPVPVAEAVR